ncbi:unnamed protein product, partial [Vicia faba]
QKLSPHSLTRQPCTCFCHTISTHQNNTITPAIQPKTKSSTQHLIFLFSPFFPSQTYPPLYPTHILYKSSFSPSQTSHTHFGKQDTNMKLTNSLRNSLDKALFSLSLFFHQSLKFSSASSSSSLHQEKCAYLWMEGEMIMLLLTLWKPWLKHYKTSMVSRTRMEKMMMKLVHGGSFRGTTLQYTKANTMHMVRKHGLRELKIFSG